MILRSLTDSRVRILARWTEQCSNNFGIYRAQITRKFKKSMKIMKNREKNQMNDGDYRAIDR